LMGGGGVLTAPNQMDRRTSLRIASVGIVIIWLGSSSSRFKPEILCKLGVECLVVVAGMVHVLDA